MNDILIQWRVKRLFQHTDEKLGVVVDKVLFQATSSADVVLPPHFEAPAGSPPVETTVHAESNGIVRLPEPGEEFTPYVDLSEKQVLEWVFAALGERGLAAIVADLTKSIERQSRPATPAEPETLPWTK